jgi:hypothetical protein
LEDYKGNYAHFIDAVYEVFERDFIKHRPVFGGFKLGLKYHPAFQERAYTFYHMTHKGDIESERTPDLRRCECISWGRPTIENVSEYSLKFWEQRRKSKRRICIWLETEDDVDYFFVLEIRKTFILPWTAFVAEYKHETIKKEREYQEWLASLNGVTYTPYELVGKMMSEMP